jgi:hypothetical protein
MARVMARERSILWRRIVVDPKLGTKRQCESCGAKFYDLNRNPIECPKCDTLFDPEVLVRRRAPEKEIAPTKDVDADTSEDDDDLDIDMDDGDVSLESLDDDDDDALDDEADETLDPAIGENFDDDDILIDDDEDDEDDLLVDDEDEEDDE